MFGRFTRWGSSKEDKNNTEKTVENERVTVESSASECASPESTLEQVSRSNAVVSTQRETPGWSSAEARFAVGIDLGTTHCVLAYMPLAGGALQVLDIPQIKAPGLCGEFAQLPSFLYVPHADEFASQELDLPWLRSESEGQPLIVGEFARQHGSKTPMRLVSSAKSWLSHSGVNCKEAFLPLESSGAVPQISPFEVTQRYLQHLQAAWLQRFPDAPLAEQMLTITVPASFDPLARQLTVEAAQVLGLFNAVLLEEPQAALYGWLHVQAETWRKQLKVGDVLLVIDVGGGTTDFSLIDVVEEAGELALQRVAVGEHILLGGDNMDLNLAYVLKNKLEKDGKKIENWQLQGLTHACRMAKEALLGNEQLSAVPVVVVSRGSSLMGNSLRTELTRDEVQATLLEGFFPLVDKDALPIKRTRAALSRKSLAYAQDAAITRHLAGFLAGQGRTLNENSDFYPSVVLFNGGVFKARAFGQRLLENINQWLGSAGKQTVKELEPADLDQAVALGAAYHAYLRMGHGLKIRAGSARSYYVGIESAMPAVPGFEPPVQAYCIAPFGMEEGCQASLPDEEFGLVVGETAVFRFYSSTCRQYDEVGTLLEHWSDGELEELDSISVNLSAEGVRRGELVAVKLQAGLTEVGTLKLDALALKGGLRWNVELNVRD